MYAIRIVPGRVINIKSEAMTSFVEDGVLQVGTPGSFQFATMELGARAIMELPPPMPLVLTVGILVRHHTTWGGTWSCGYFICSFFY